MLWQSKCTEGGQGRRRWEQWEEKKEHKKQVAETTAEPGAKTFKWSNCDRVCDSRIRLYSLSRLCSYQTGHTMGVPPTVSRDRRTPTSVVSQTSQCLLTEMTIGLTVLKKPWSLLSEWTRWDSGVMMTEMSEQ